MRGRCCRFRSRDEAQRMEDLLRSFLQVRGGWIGRGKGVTEMH